MNIAYAASRMPVAGIDMPADFLLCRLDRMATAESLVTQMIRR
jgi:hypothetical protein